MLNLLILGVRSLTLSADIYSFKNRLVLGRVTGVASEVGVVLVPECVIGAERLSRIPRTP